MHEDDAYLSLPILSLPGVVLVPGQTLPLHLFQSSTVALIQRVVNGDKTFGIVTSRYGMISCGVMASYMGGKTLFRVFFHFWRNGSKFFLCCWCSLIVNL